MSSSARKSDVFLIAQLLHAVVRDDSTTGWKRPKTVKRPGFTDLILPGFRCGQRSTQQFRNHAPRGCSAAPRQFLRRSKHFVVDVQGCAHDFEPEKRQK